jgi:hypothetical protein
MVLRIVSIVLALGAAVAMLLTLFSAGQRAGGVDDLPWHVRVDPAGDASVLGVRLGKTSLAELEARLGEPAEIAVFLTPKAAPSVEAYWNNVPIGAFVVKLAASLAADPDRIAELQAEARRSEPTPSGARKLSLDARTEGRVRTWPITDLTYAPTFVQLEALTLRQRFGAPESIEPLGPQVQVWLYPALGVAVTLAEEGKDLIHYVPPRDFSRLRARLLTQDGERQASP